ncbi:MAG: M16 family metallopeptidase [Bacteroidota bacterium]
MLTRFASLLFVSLLLTFSMNISAADKTPAASSLPKISPLPKGVSVHRLDNGLQVLLIENSALPVIGANVIVKIGSAYETFSTSGSSHMLEHLLFNGTTTRDQKKLYDDVDRIGGYNNATTEDFFTNYMFVVPVENTRKGLEIQADMLFNSTIPVDKFQKEKGIVLEEISKSIADPTDQLERNTLSVLYRGHALSMPTLGTYSTIEALSREDVYSFYKNNYVPNNMVLTVIGNFQTSTMLPLIKEIYGKAKPGQVRRDEYADWKTGFQLLTDNNSAAGTIFHQFYSGKDDILQLFYPLPAGKSSEYYHLLGVVLDKNKDTLSSALKSRFPKIKDISFSQRLSHLGDLLEAKITVSAGANFDSIAQAVNSRLAGLKIKLPTEVVLSEAVKERTEFGKNIEKPHMFGIYYSGTIVSGGVEELLNSFLGDNYNSSAKELESLVIGPYRTGIIQQSAAAPEKGQEASSIVTKRFADAATGRNIIVLQNTSGKLLAIHYLVKHKAFFESKYGKDAAKVLHNTLEQRLTSDANKKIAGKFGFSFTVNDNPFIPMDDIYLHPDFGYIRVEGLADDVPGAIRFLNSQLNGFIPTEEEYKKALEKFKSIGFALAGGDKGKKLFEETYRTNIYEQNPYGPTQKELTYADLAAFSKEYLRGSNTVISVVSPAQPDSVNAAFEQFGFTAYSEPPVFSPGILLHDAPVTIEKKNGGERSYLFWGFSKKIDPADAPALQALSLILNDQIVFDIREKQGLAYNISAGIEVNNDKALFYINQGSRPKNVDTLVAQYPRFFKSTVLDSLTAEQLEKSVNQYLGRMVFRHLSSINKAFYLGSSLYLNNDSETVPKFLSALRKVTLDDVRTVAKKYLTVSNPVSIIVR